MEGIKIYGVTPDYEKIRENKNINDIIRTNIQQFKIWSKKNFFFEANVVRYLNETPNLSEFPIELEEEPEYRKSEFDTPFSHLLYFAFLTGRKMQVDDTNKAIQALCKDFGESKTNMIL